MKIATYNIQNLFHRDKSLLKERRLERQDDWNEELETLFAKKNKAEQDYIRMRELAILLGFNKSPFEPYLSIRNLNGQLMIEASPLDFENKASELNDWNGWIRLATNPLTKNAIRNKAKVIVDTDADILFLQEVENRKSLLQFNTSFLIKEMENPYAEIIYMDGNETKGLGMGILLKKEYRITAIRSFANERDLDEEPLFNGNVLQFKITNSSAIEVYIISCQLSPESDNLKLENKRKRQAAKIAEIYKDLQTQGHKNIIILGNLNAPCYSKYLTPILKDTNLKDIVKHDTFEADLDLGDHSGYYRMGGYRKGVNIKQKDYLLLSPSLFKIVNSSGLNRKAIWPSKIPKWNLYKSVTNELDAASAHPLIWTEISL